jgi:hypothetical protein
MGKKRKTPSAIPQPSPVDVLEMYAVLYRDDRPLSQTGADRLKAVRSAFVARDWGRALCAAFDLGEWCHGAEALPTVLQLAQTEIELVPFENKARRQEAARQDEARKRKASGRKSVWEAYESLTPEQHRDLDQGELESLLAKMVVEPDPNAPPLAPKTKPRYTKFGIRKILASLKITRARRWAGLVQQPTQF